MCGEKNALMIGTRLGVQKHEFLSPPQHQLCCLPQTVPSPAHLDEGVAPDLNALAYVQSAQQ